MAAEARPPLCAFHKHEPSCAWEECKVLLVPHAAKVGCCDLHGILAARKAQGSSARANQKWGGDWLLRERHRLSFSRGRVATLVGCESAELYNIELLDNPISADWFMLLLTNGFQYDPAAQKESQEEPQKESQKESQKDPQKEPQKDPQKEPQKEPSMNPPPPKTASDPFDYSVFPGVTLRMAVAQVPGPKSCQMNMTEIGNQLHLSVSCNMPNGVDAKFLQMAMTSLSSMMNWMQAPSTEGAPPTPPPPAAGPTTSR